MLIPPTALLVVAGVVEVDVTEEPLLKPLEVPVGVLRPLVLVTTL
jgi:hypothetical protein